MVAVPTLSTLRYHDAVSHPTFSVSKGAVPYPFLPSFGKSRCVLLTHITVRLTSHVLVLVARASLLSVLQNANIVGHIQIDDCDETLIIGDERKGGNSVYLKVTNSNFWTRVFLYVHIAMISDAHRHSPRLNLGRYGDLGCKFRTYEHVDSH